MTHTGFLGIYKILIIFFRVSVSHKYSDIFSTYLLFGVTEDIFSTAVI